MHSSLRILQITLIITQITTVKGSSSVTVPASTVSSVDAGYIHTTSFIGSYSTMPSAATSVKAEHSTTAWQNSSGTASSLKTLETSSVYSSSMQTVSPTTSVLVTSVKVGHNETAPQNSSGTASSLKTLETSSVYSSSTQTVSLTTKVHVNSSLEQLTNSSGVSATPSTILTSTSLKSSVPGKATQTVSQKITVSNSTSIKLTTRTNNTISVASTEATNLNPSGLMTSQTQSTTANYSLSSASRGTSIVSPTAESKQTLTTSLPVSVNWTDWSVDSSDCTKYCSEKGGTVTASRHCYSRSKTLEDKVCTKQANLTKVVKCGGEHCPISGKEAFGRSISTLAVSILLVMLSSTFVQD